MADQTQQVQSILPFTLEEYFAAKMAGTAKLYKYRNAYALQYQAWPSGIYDPTKQPETKYVAVSREQFAAISTQIDEQILTFQKTKTMVTDFIAEIDEAPDWSGPVL